MRKDLTVKTQLLSEEKNTFRVLHGVYGFDFEKPYLLEMHQGKFTIASLKKKYNIGADDKTVLLLINRVKKIGCLWERLKVVKVNGNTVDIDFRAYEVKCRSKLDNFIVKYDFEDMRKDENTICYIISQNNEYINKPQKKQIDKSDRFKILDSRAYGSYNGHKGYIHGLTVYSTDSCRTFEYSPSYETLSTTDLIDKSGYFTEKESKDLKRRLASYKAEKDKERMSTVDPTKIYFEMMQMCERLKESIATKILLMPLHYESFSKVRHSALYDMADMCLSLEIFKEKIDKKTFSGLSEIEKRSKAMQERYNKIVEALGEI